MKIILLAILLVSSAQAMEVTPFLAYLDNFGKNSSAIFIVKNDNNKPIAIETIVKKVELDEENSEKKQDNVEDFFIMPPQSLIQPGKSQTFRVKYIGTSESTVSQIYRVNFNQLPLEQNTESEGATVRMLFNFSSLVFVSPLNSKPVLNTRIINDRKGKNISIINIGNKVLDLSRAKVTLVGTESKKELSWLEVHHMTGFQFVLPLRERKFYVSSNQLPSEIGDLITIKIEV